MIFTKRDARDELYDLCNLSDTLLLQERDPSIKYGAECQVEISHGIKPSCTDNCIFRATNCKIMSCVPTQYLAFARHVIGNMKGVQ
jgi:hypothetical protein